MSDVPSEDCRPMSMGVGRVRVPRKRKWSEPWHRFLTVVFAFAVTWLLRLVCRSNRLTTTEAEVLQRYVEQGGNIFAFWHDRLFYLAYFYVKNSRGRKVTMLVSLSRDGDYGVALVRRLGQEVVRGSTSRGGRRAVSELARTIAEGGNVGITPDGPRGPAHKVNEGTIKLAQITGARIIPVSFDASRKHRLHSWDRFILVKPFGRVHVAVGGAIEVPRRITAEERERYCRQLERSLSHLDRICAERLAGSTL
ncbi:MAG: lysophospholipid acyltransferase family protein [Phycisphaerales bacterium]|nr:MAG: lysophospholipid acyltransferase family protein [Phycisphaerales bacterium]